MQVTHQNGHVTHAVIGGKATIDFGISSSAEFFNILSSTLYKDQILAVVREVLCNAWDAHIEAGCTDKPVEITLTSDKFTIKDFGTGIHHDDMGPIYGTYGNSTKKNDGNQTGGFGLGCKAPFAYTDHFEVISSHANVRTIYNLSKSSAQAQGKPGIIPIASFPTDEHGLQVAIRVKNHVDHRRFNDLIERIARNGDMNMTLNGKPIDKLGFDTSKGNYLLTHGTYLLDNHTSIMVRYGNVIYPIDTNNELGERYGKINQHLSQLGSHPSYRIIFQAPAHSISVTPSRESLSMQEHTVNTLNTLFEGFLKSLDTEFHPKCHQYASQVTQQAVTDVRIKDLLSRKACLPVPRGTLQTVDNISDMWTMANRYMTLNYPSDITFRKRDIKQRLELMTQAKLLDRGMVSTYLRDLERVQKGYKERSYRQEDTTWLQRRVIAPLVSKMIKAGLNHAKLYVCDPEDSNNTDRYHGYISAPLIPANKARPAHHIAALPYLRNIVVLASAKTGMADRAFKHEVFKKLGATYGFLFYHVGMKVADKAAAVAFFNSTGMQVVDLTFRQDWEPEPEKSIKVARKPKPKGIVALSALSIPSTRYGHTIYTKNFYKEDALRIEKPEFVVQLSFKQHDSSYQFPDMDSESSDYIMKLFGDKGGAVATTAAKEACILKGAKDIKEYVSEKVCTYMQTNPRIQKYWAYSPDRVVRESRITAGNNRQLIRLIYSNPVLMKAFSITNKLTEEDNMYIHLWKQICSRSNYFKSSAGLVATTTHLDAIPLNKANAILIEKIATNPLLDVININQISHLITNENTSSPALKKALALLIKVIND